MINYISCVHLADSNPKNECGDQNNVTLMIYNVTLYNIYNKFWKFLSVSSSEMKPTSEDKIQG